LTKVWKYL